MLPARSKSQACNRGGREGDGGGGRGLEAAQWVLRRSKRKRLTVPESQFPGMPKIGPLPPPVRFPSSCLVHSGGLSRACAFLLTRFPCLSRPLLKNLTAECALLQWGTARALPRALPRALCATVCCRFGFRARVGDYRLIRGARMNDRASPALSPHLSDCGYST